MPQLTTYLFAIGETGGHLFPAIAVSEELLRRDAQTRCVIAGNGCQLEHEITTQYSLEYRPVPSVSPAGAWRRPIKFFTTNLRAVRTAGRLIDQLQPRAVIGCGAFASLATVWAASQRKIPIVLLEQNVLPGNANRFLSRWADVVCVSFEESRHTLPRARKIIVTGNPVRDEFLSLQPVTDDTTESVTDDATQTSPKRLLVLGGSLGSKAVNGAMTTFVTHHTASLSEWKIIHQTGADQVDEVRSVYRHCGVDAEVLPFLSDMPEQLTRASLIVSGSGATTLAEIAIVGRPVITIPFAAAKDDHQTINARWYESRNAAIMICEGAELDGEFCAKLQPLLSDNRHRTALATAIRQTAQPHAGKRIVDIITKQRTTLLQEREQR